MRGRGVVAGGIGSGGGGGHEAKGVGAPDALPEHKIKEMARMLIQKSEFLERQKRDLVDRDHEELEVGAASVFVCVCVCCRWGCPGVGGDLIAGEGV